ncbi:MAG: hypothetical protein ACWGQW_06475 [bacterium]
MNQRMEFGGRALIIELLEANKHAIHPGKGIVNSQLVRRVCHHYGLQEDEFLPRFVVRDKKNWGL